MRELLIFPVAISSNGDGFVIQYRKNCGPQGADLSDRQALLKYTPEEITARSDKYIVRITGDDPVAKGYCCDVCNMKVVVPERIKQSYKPKGANKDENRKNTSRTRR